MGLEIHNDLVDWFDRISSAQNLDDLDKRMAISSILTEYCKRIGLDPPILVGGSAVALYTRGKYGTVDIDMIVRDHDRISQIMVLLGYQKEGKDYVHTKAKSYVEFPSGLFSGTEEEIIEYICPVTSYPVYVIGPEDMILDRVDSFVSTNDQGSREWAERMMASLYPEIDWSYLHKQANKRFILPQVEKLQRNVKRYMSIHEKYFSIEGIKDSDVF